jgi:5-methylcytosine-specific restriction protein A
MINLNSHLHDISNRFGYELYLENVLQEKSGEPCIRFRIDSNLDTFHLKISRSWKTTRVQLVPGAFANQVVQYLCKEVLSHKFELENLLEDPDGKLSDYSLQIDNQDYSEVLDLDEKTHSLQFYVETMTSESSIEHGLLNEREAAMVELAASVIVALLPRPATAYSSPEEVVGFPEGATTQVLVNKYERDPRNRAAAIAAHGYRCLACGFDFKSTYGDLGENFIIVHHVVPVSKIGPDYRIDPKMDLISLCANCHAMIHRQDPPLTLEELKNTLT